MGNIKKFGDWEKARKLSNGLGDEISHANKVALMQVGLQTERMVVKYIQSQPKEWPSLDPKYLRYKERKGYSNLMLRKTGTYINSIRSYVEDANSLVFVGVKKEIQNEDGEVLANIGAVMEYGSEKRNVKARPHFGPIRTEMLRKIQEEKLFTKFLNESLRRKYGLH